MKEYQADALTNKYGYLVGKVVDGRFISAIFKTPFNHTRIHEIALNLIKNLSSFDIYRHQSEFDVVVAFDLDSWKPDLPFDWLSLFQFLEEHPDLSLPD
ncbi:hypothetical protein [Pararcticibacter amylolyticus]|uniref:hypothetical protein n=1 Tax=Pararcticibacter amylolyticus TaxID=2173175 RepID=UPI0011B25BF6|nr:hypothetical protein [Pararcticibacter amylolyticus]